MERITRSEISDSNKGFKLPIEYQVPLPIHITDEIEKREDKLSIWQIIWFLVKQSPTIIKIVYKIIKLIEVLKMKDGKTTFIATVKVIMGIIAAVVGLFGVNIGAEVNDAIIAVCTSGYFLFSWIQGLLTRDKDE